MTIIVEHKRTGNQYVLLAINGENNQVNPSRFLSELFTQEKPESSSSVTVCDIRGNIFLAYVDDLIVIEIDGKKIAEILPESSFEEVAEPVNDRFNSDLNDRDFEEDFEQEQQNIEETETASVNTQSSFTSQEMNDDGDWI